MNKRVLISLASAALLSVGTFAVVNDGNVQSQTVQAAKKAKTFKIQLKKNAKVYTKRGKRKGKKVLKKGHYYTAYAKVTIHGRKYYHISKGRYIKATTAKKAKVRTVSNSTPVNTSSSANTNASSNTATSTTKNFSVTVTKPTTVYNSKGQPTGVTLKKGLKEMTYGTKTINGKKYYLIGGNHYILVSDISNVNTGTISNNKPNSTDGSESGDKPTQAEIDYLLANNNDKLGYTVYFSDNELTKIKKYLWQDIQNYRIEKGLPAYKTNTELEDFVGNVTSTETNLWKYESNLNAATADQLATYLPSLSKNGMDISDSFDIPNYYGHGEVGSSQPSSFNFKDRDPEHVATQIFNSFKESKDYNSMILGDNDQLAFAAIGLHYNWHGTSPKTSVGVVFIEVSGSSSKWESFYNIN